MHGTGSQEKHASIPSHHFAAALLIVHFASQIPVHVSESALPVIPLPQPLPARALDGQGTEHGARIACEGSRRPE